MTELSPDEWPYKGKTSYVLTHKDIQNSEEIIFTDMEISKLATQLKEESGKDIYLLICSHSPF